MMADWVAKELAEHGGIGVRFGCHCAHLLIKRLLHIPAPLALLQGVIVSVAPRVVLPGLTRVSLGIETSAEEIDAFLHASGKITGQIYSHRDNPFAANKPLSRSAWTPSPRLQFRESTLRLTEL